MMVTAVMGFAMTAAAPLFAQQPSEHTLGSLWPEVEKAYPGIKAKNAAVGAAKFNLDAEKSNILPQMKAQVQNTYGTYEGSAGAFFPQAGFFNVSGGADLRDGGGAANSFASATLEWDLFSFGKLRKKNQAAAAQLNSSISKKDAYVLNLKKELAERYITLLYNEAKLRWRASNAARLDTISKLAAGLSAAGIQPAADSLLASSSYTQAMGNHDKWDGYKQAAFIKLLELSGGDNVDYGGSEQRFTHVTAPYVDADNTVNARHPVLNTLDKQSLYYAYSGQAEKSAYLPSVRLLGGYAYRGTGIGRDGAVSHSWQSGFQNTTNNVLAGIGMTWNITSLKTGRLKSVALFKEAEEAKHLRVQYARALQADLSAAKAKISRQYAQLQKTELSVLQAGDAYKMYLARYKSGLITLTELLQIRTLLEQAEDSHIEASHAYWLLLAEEAAITANFDFLFNNL